MIKAILLPHVAIDFYPITQLMQLYNIKHLTAFLNIYIQIHDSFLKMKLTILPKNQLVARIFNELWDHFKLFY